MRVFAAGLATETNTFFPKLTELADFAVRRRGDTDASSADDSSFDLQRLWGCLSAERGYEFVLGLMAWAQPSGVTRATAYETLRDEILRDLDAAMPVDIVLLMLHGAMVAEGYEDCERDLISRVRAVVGTRAVVAAEFDLHCHLGVEKISGADLVLLYKEYPHVDINDRGRELFELAVRTRMGEISPTMELFDCRMLGIYPTTRKPLRGFVDSMTEAEKRPGVLSVSFGHGFQFGDVSNLGAKVLAISDADPRLATEVAQEFGMRAYAIRDEIGFHSFSKSMDEALRYAVAQERGPVIVADQSDNPGGGAPGDATYVLRWLLERRVRNVAMAIIFDPDTVRTAREAGVGSKIRTKVGGKLGPFSGAPVEVEAVVSAVRTNYMHAFPQRSGAPILYRAGDLVRISIAGIEILVSSERCQCMSPSIFTDVGVDVSSTHMIVVKSAQHFYSAFASIATEVIYMTAPGAVPPDPRRLIYRVADIHEMHPWVLNPLGE